MPVVRGKEELTDEELEIYSRQIVLRDIGYKGQLRLRRARVCVVGLGGLGCPTATQLTAMGVGHLRLVDRDVVERSNFHRQHLYTIDTIGYPKVEAAAKRLGELNPGVDIEALTLSVNPDTSDEIVRGVDVVVDGLDSVEARYAINRACLKHGVPYVFGAAIETFGNVSTFIPGETPCLECLYHDLRDGVLPVCAVVGVHPSVLGIVSSLQVSEAVRLVLGERPRLAGKLLFVDVRNMSFDEFSLLQWPKCPVCGDGASEEAFPLRRRLIEEVCGRGGKRVFIVNPKDNLSLDIGGLYKLVRGKGAEVKAKASLG
ncbi:MAG: ThiF family adenylyltransferase, partial [Candidatus Bathyarchaeia archaeon]